MANRTFTFDAEPHHELVLGGKTYHGGDKLSVSEAQAASLLADPSIPIKEEFEELAKLSREKLEQIAQDKNIDPSGFRTKDDLVEAIEQGVPDHQPSPLEEAK